MLMQLRKNVAKVVTFILLSLLILSFAVWGIGPDYIGGGQIPNVAEVGDIEIRQSEFDRDLAREMNRLRQRFGGQLDIQQARALGVVDQVLQQLITRALFDQQAGDLDMLVSRDQIQQQILEQPAFQNELGDFESARFFQVLRANSLSEEDYIRSLSRDINRQQIIDALSGATEAPGTLAERLYVYENESRVAETITVTMDILPALADPSQEDLEAIHKDHADRFRSPEYRALSYIYLDAEGYRDEASITEDVLRAEFDSRPDDFRVPEQRDLRQMVFPDEAQAKAAKTLLGEGVAFADVSRSTLGRDPVELGKLSRDELSALLPALTEAAFSLEQGIGSDPVESPFGWHILLVTEVEPGLEPDFDRVRDDLAEDIVMSAAVERLITTANDLDAELASEASLEEAAEILGLTVARVTAMDQGGRDLDGNLLESLPTLAEFSALAFQTSLDETSLLSETRNGNFLVVRVDTVTSPAARPLEEVREEVAGLWRQLERDRLLRERAEELAERARGPEEMTAIAEAEGLQFATTEPLLRRQAEAFGSADRELAAKLFDVAPGEVTTAQGADGYLVAKLIEIRKAKPSEDAAKLTEVQDNLAASLQGDLLEAFIATLRRDIGVSVNDRAVDSSVSRL